MPSPSNLVVIAAAGSAKTQFILDEVIANPDRRALITTYTNENIAQIEHRLREANAGVIPAHVTVMSWFSLMVNECIRPYQRSVFGEANYVRAFNFIGEKNNFTKKEDPHHYFLDSNRDVYRDGASDLACEIDARSGGLVAHRLSSMFDEIYIDELQDLAGWDLEFLDLLLAAPARVIAVGDPRQQTFVTNRSRKNLGYKGVAMVKWFEARQDRCELLVRNKCFRSNQAICDFADSIYPQLPRTESTNTEDTGHDGIFPVTRAEVVAYHSTHNPVVLRWDRDADTMGLPARNFGVSKGSTYDRVIIFPTKSMLAYYKKRNLSKLTSKEKLYVAVTRARFSVAFVID